MTGVVIRLIPSGGVGVAEGGGLAFPIGFPGGGFGLQVII